MESLYKTHQYLVEHQHLPLRRKLMNEIDWNDRLIGIKGSRGVGKTSFLIQYAKEHFAPDNRECLYINLNNFYFTVRTIKDFANEFRMAGGKVLLIDQVFKYPDWASELVYCYDNYPDLQIIFTCSSVMRLKSDNSPLVNKVVSYNLRGFSFREYIELMTGETFNPYCLKEIIQHHAAISTEICSKINPLAYMADYLHHGFYPFFLEKRNFSENLLKTMNMMLEVDVLSINQMEQSYLPKIRKLLYLLSLSAPDNANITRLSREIKTSRATVMNYIKYLKDARLVNLLYPVNEDFPKKPTRLYLQNPNLLYATRMIDVEEKALRETFFYNQVHKDYKVNSESKNVRFLVDGKYAFNIVDKENRKIKPDIYYGVADLEKGSENCIPLWLFGFLY
ncbi:MAG: AAA family ATPase [Dysgonamonadaceae bacterium]|jgi:predicted AAA+ superfamily ATPase|nr:AAA family ATPase [Dysgonamonadaceae bacterium]